ncbi:MAG: hypothetical protein NC429_10410 [Lachnospiraceae bacterium]|nr:hypothetical protein [Lachnospiraceae bacterium]
MKEQIKVNTGTLKEKCEEWLETAETAKKNLADAETIMEGLQASFCSEAASRIQKAFEQLTDRGLRQIESICGHLCKLIEIAEGYEEAEKENELVSTDN